MKVLLMTCELREESKKKYPELYSIIKTAPYWWHYLENTWLIATDNSPKYWYEKLTSTNFKKDRFFIVEITKDYWGALPGDAWKWITDHFGYAKEHTQ